MPRVSGAQASLRMAWSQPLGDWIADAAFSRDGSEVAAAAADGAVTVVAVAGGGPRELAHHSGGALALGFAPDGTLASAGADGRLVLVPGPAVEVGAGWVEHVAWSPTGGAVAAAEGRRVRLYAPDGSLRAQSEPLPATVSCIGWHPARKWLAAGSYEGVRLLGAGTLSEAATLAWKGSVLELAFSPDGTRLAHGNQDASVHFWELATRRELEMAGYERKVRELAWSPDGRWLATGGGSAVVAWDFAGKGPAGTRPIELEGHVEPLTKLAFRGDGVLASACRDGLVHLWLPGTDDLPIATAAVEGEVSALAFAPDGDALLVGGSDGALSLFEVADR